MTFLLKNIIYIKNEKDYLGINDLLTESLKNHDDNMLFYDTLNKLYLEIKENIEKY